MNKSLNRVSALTPESDSIKNLKQPFRDRRNEIPHKRVNESIRKPKNNSTCVVNAENVKQTFTTKFDESILYEVQRVSSNGLKLLFRRVACDKPAMIPEHISKTVNPKPKPAVCIRDYARRNRPNDCQLFFPTSDNGANEFILQTPVKGPETSSANKNCTQNLLSLKSNVAHFTSKSDEQNKMEKILARLKAEKEAKLMEKVRIYRAQLVVAKKPC